MKVMQQYLPEFILPLLENIIKYHMPLQNTDYNHTDDLNIMA